MDLGKVLLDLVVVLLAARLAAEGAERLRQPAVLAEIAIGIVIGPSALGLIEPGSALTVVGELGALLLLFEVGRQMDLDDLRHVGGASLRVAVIGVAVPMALGYAAMRMAGVSSAPAIFLAGGITATSVGITARVFGDLRALARVEARTVLGAAVADDVIGLLVLTVVVGAVSGTGVRPGSVAAMTALAVAFVGGAAVFGSWLVPRLLDGLTSRARAEGTVLTVGLVLALGFARAAVAVQLAPIVGAFVAGMAVGRSDAAEDLHRRLAPLGQLLIPVFFLQIGLDARLSAFADPWVLAVAGILTLVAVAGKLVSGLGAGGRQDRLLVGAGMVPRGEVGLIFAALGLQKGVLDPRTYGVLLFVVLATTVITPPWLRRRLERVRRDAVTVASAAIEPPQGWLRTTGSEVELAGEPPPALAGLLALRAALLCRHRRPGRRLVGWLAEQSNEPQHWNEQVREAFFDLLLDGTERSWLLLEVGQMLPALSPDLAAAIGRRPRDPFALEPAGSVRFPVLEGLREVRSSRDQAVQAWDGLKDHRPAALTALVRSVTSGRGDAEAAAAARRIASAIGLEPEQVEATAVMVAERHLLPAAAARLDMGTEAQVLDLISYVETREILDGLYVLAVAENGMETWERARLDTLWELVEDALDLLDPSDRPARDLADRRRREVARSLPHLDGERLESLMDTAPGRYLLAHPAEAIARHVQLAWNRPARLEARLHADPGPGPNEWTVHVTMLDRPGLLAAIAQALAGHGLSVIEAHISTWRSGVAVDVFRVTGPPDVPWDQVRRSIETNIRTRGDRNPTPTVDGLVEIDNRASPWHTVVVVRAKDRAGLLFRVASALSRAGFLIHQATVTTVDGVALDTFWVTDRAGGKLTAAGERALMSAFAGRRPRRWAGSRFALGAAARRTAV